MVPVHSNASQLSKPNMPQFRISPLYPPLLMLDISCFLSPVGGELHRHRSKQYILTSRYNFPTLVVCTYSSIHHRRPSFYFIRTNPSTIFQPSSAQLRCPTFSLGLPPDLPWQTMDRYSHNHNHNHKTYGRICKRPAELAIYICTSTLDPPWGIPHPHYVQAQQSIYRGSKDLRRPPSGPARLGNGQKLGTYASSLP